MGISDVGRCPVIYAVSGYKNSGKTAFITRLIPHLTGRGYKVAVIKHDGHGFEGDVPGTDTFRHMEAGAYGTAIFSKGHYMINMMHNGISERDLIPLFPDADIIIIEGLKDSDYPKYICSYPDKVPSEDEVRAVAEEIERMIRREKHEEIR